MRTRRLTRLFLAIALVSCFSPNPAEADAKRSNTAAIAASKSSYQWWRDRYESMNRRVAEGDVDMILIGDSITQGWEGAGKKVWEEYYAPRHAVNLGIGADGTQHVLWRLDHGNIDGISPRLAMIMIGTNNTGMGNYPRNTPQEIAEGIKLIVEKLRSKLPNTKILLLAIFPRGADDNDGQRQAARVTNKLIARLDDGDMVEYLDIGRSFLNPDGTTSKTIMPDLLHLSEAGYRIWAEAVEPSVAAAMQPPMEEPSIVCRCKIKRPVVTRFAPRHHGRWAKCRR